MTTAPEPTPNILLINRNRDGLLVRGALLRELGYNVTAAQTGEEGLKHFEASAFHLVVLDYHMPRTNGVELIVRLRKVSAQARVILISGQVDALNLTPETTGADVVIAKSATEAAQLGRAIKRLLNRQPARKPPASQKRGASRTHAAAR
ncbi:MAG TPA: response regulator [Bryobacteraceae bacterium]|nr:response regulator [Bryobacteraceae bacterium]